MQCAYCPPDGSLPCLLVGEYTSREECESAVICETPSGEWLTGLTSEQCTATETSCSVDCLLAEPVCTSFLQLEGVCQFLSEAACDSADGAVNDGSGCFSTAITDASTCTAAGGEWQTCTGLPSCDVSSDAGEKLQCIMWPWGACENQGSCESSGRCSDRDFTISLDNDSTALKLGACYSSGYIHYDSDTTTVCTFSHQRTANGCLTSIAESECFGIEVGEAGETLNLHEWRTPAYTEAECMMSDHFTSRGCFMPSVREQRTLWYEPDMCVECGGEPASAWQWTRGSWRSAQPRSLQWVRAETLPTHTWTSAINFDKFSQWARAYAEYRVSFGLRSSGICSFEAVTAPLSVLACSCLGLSHGSEDCFTSSSKLRAVALARPCIEQETVYRTPSALITFFNDSLVTLCTTVGTFEIQQSAVTVPTVRPSLEFQLAAGKQPDGVVQNRAGRVVGQLNSNGVWLNISDLDRMAFLQVCLKIQRSTPSDSYSTVPDFGAAFTSTLGVVVVPMGLAVQAAIIDGQDFWCSEVTGDQLVGLPTLFAVHRVSDYKEGSFDQYTSSEVAMSYTLGALFLVVIGAALIFAMQWLSDGKFKFFVYLIAVPLFLCLAVFRVVYCFALPSGTWADNAVAGFIVFELPSFLYFSACCLVALSLVDIVACFWKNFQFRARMVILVLLVCAWCLFVAVAIADGVLQHQDNEQSPCPGRVASSTDINSKLRALSIAYQSILISLTLLLTVFMLYLLALVFRSAMVAHTNAAEALLSLKEMLKDGLSISFAFLTRCVLFIVYLSVNLSSTTYIFVTLLVTEVLLIIFLLVVWMLRFSNSKFRFSHSATSEDGHSERERM